MRMATFNINGIEKRLTNLLQWLEREQPDVVCLQGLKCEHGRFPVSAPSDAGYGAVWSSERSWNDVAILARDLDPILTREMLPGDAADRQTRYIEAAVRGVLIACLYLPNGNPFPGPKFTYKLAWFDRLHRHAAELIASGLPVVLAGDFNVVHRKEDIYVTRSLDKNALVQPQSRRAYRHLLEQGWTDSLNHLYPGQQLWTFWDYKYDRWELDKGMRLDHILLAPSLDSALVEAGVDRWVRGEENASDHAPAWVSLALENRSLERD